MDEDVDIRKLFSPFTNVKAVCYLIIVGFIIFSNGLINSFLGDDLGQIVGNSYLNSINNLPSFFFGSTFYNGGSLAGNYYRPITLVLFSIINLLFGTHAFFFHLAQILIFLTNSVFVYFIFRKYFKALTSFLLALIFLIHPINSESALYISDTQEVLFMFFGLLSFIFLQNFNNKKAYFMSVILLLLSLLSKETGVVFILLNTFYLYTFRTNDFRKFFYLPYIALTTYLLLRFLSVGFQNPSNSVIAQQPFVIRLLNIPMIVLFYLKTFFFPFPLSSSYQWVVIKPNFNNFYLPLLITLFVFGVLGYYIIYCKKSNRKFKLISLFAFIFVVGGILHLQIIPLDATVGIRWFYFSSLGLLGLIGVVLTHNKKLTNNKLFIALIIFTIITLSTLTIKRTFDFRNTYSLATHDVKVSPEAYGLYNILSYDAFQKGEFEKAKKFAEKSIELHPFMTNYLNLGASKFATGDYTGAYESFRKSLKYGDYYQTYENLALLSLSYGDADKNIDFIKKVSLKKFPRSGKLWLFLAALEYNFGDKNFAKIAISNALKLEQSDQIKSAYYSIYNDLPVRIGLKK